MSSIQANGGHTSRLVAEFAGERVDKPNQPIGLLFELIATDRPPVQVVDGVGEERPWT
jgi:hypothetical protein